MEPVQLTVHIRGERAHEGDQVSEMLASVGLLPDDVVEDPIVSEQVGESLDIQNAALGELVCTPHQGLGFSNCGHHVLLLVRLFKRLLD